MEVRKIVFISLDGSPNFRFRKNFIVELSKHYDIVIISLYIRGFKHTKNFFGEQVQIQTGLIALLKFLPNLLFRRNYLPIFSMVKDIIMFAPLMSLKNQQFLGLIEGLGKLYLSYTNTFTANSPITRLLYLGLFNIFLKNLSISSGRYVVLNHEDHRFVSRYAKNEVLMLNGFGQHEHTQNTLYNSLNADNDVTIEKQEFTCLFIGRGIRTKGINDFLELANCFEHRHLNIKFTIIGTICEIGPESVNIENFISFKNNSNCKHIFWCNDLWNLIADMPRPILCVPSLREGLSSVISEAAIRGIPILGKNVPGVHDFNILLGDDLVEIVDDFVVEGAVKLISLAENYETRSQLTNDRFLIHEKKFSSVHNANNLSQFINKNYK